MKTHKHKAVIFDLDGVITDTARYHFLAWKKIADKLGIPFTEKDNERLKGVSRKESLEILLRLGDKKLSPAEKEKFLEEKNRIFNAYIDKMNEEEILPGIRNVLNYLRFNHIPVALGSASKNARKILDALGLSRAFDVIVDGNEVQKAKPDPEVFLKAAEKLGVEPENCIVVEDAAAGIQAARLAGMKSIGIGKPAILKEADDVIPHTRFLKDILVKYLKA